MILASYMDGVPNQTAVSGKEFEQEYDVIVAGLGTAGAIAAIAAARKGLKVLGVEKTSYMGGTGTGGFIFGYCYGLNGGICDAIDLTIQEEMNKGDYLPCGRGISADLKKLFLEKEALAAGVTLAYESAVTGVYLEGKTVKGLQYLSTTGLHCAKAKFVLDCTGDAQVCFLAGCPTAKGRDVDGQFQPFTNVRSIIREAGNLSTVNFDSGYIDQTIADDLSETIIQSGRLHLKEQFEEQHKLIAISDIPGIREGRRIIGEENLKFSDVLDDRLSREPIVWSLANHDTHSSDWAFESEAAQDWGVAASLWGIDFYVPVPVGAIIPKGYNGLLVAGRCLAADHDLAQSLRMKYTVQQLGEAAAVIACLAITHNIPAVKVEYQALADELRRTGCLGEDHFTYNSSRWLVDAKSIRDGLASEKPGIAMWSASRLGNKIIPSLKKWLSGSPESSHLKCHCAFALALLGDKTGIPELREMVVRRDDFLPQTSRNWNQHRGYAAVYLLGRLRDAGSISILENILADENIKFRFQYCSHAVMALIKTGDRHAAARPRIAAILKTFAGQPGLSIELTLKGWLQNPLVTLQMATLIRIIIANRLEKWHIPHNIDRLLIEKKLSVHEQNILRRLLPHDSGA